MTIICLPLPTAIEMLSLWVEANPYHEKIDEIKEMLQQAEFLNQLLNSGNSPATIN